MDFKQLYEFSLKTMLGEGGTDKFRPITVFDIKAFLIDNTPWLGGINFHPVSCDPDDPYGHFECYGEEDSRWDDADSWVVLVTYNDDESVLNTCKRRFVWLKELMHVFDPADSYTCSKEHFFNLMSDIETRPIDPSDAYSTENWAKWLALLIFVPKPFRDEAVKQIQDEGVSEYEIALKFRIPEAVVSALTSPHYDKAMDKYLK